ALIDAAQFGECDRGADRRMAREGQLEIRGEDADCCCMSSTCGRRNEDRLRKVDLPRYVLHVGGVEPRALLDDGERVACKRPVREDIVDMVSATGHGFSFGALATCPISA